VKRIEGNQKGFFILSDDKMVKMDGLVSPKSKRLNRPNWGTTIFHDDEAVDLVWACLWTCSTRAVFCLECIARTGLVAAGPVRSNAHLQTCLVKQHRMERSHPDVLRLQTSTLRSCVGYIPFINSELCS